MIILHGSSGIQWIKLVTGLVSETQPGSEAALRPGRVLEGEVLKAGVGRLLLSILGQRVEARSDVDLAEGAKVRLMVRSIEDGRLILQVVDSAQTGPGSSPVLPDVQPAVLPSPTGEGLIYISLFRTPEEPDDRPASEGGSNRANAGGGEQACILMWESPVLGPVRVSVRLDPESGESGSESMEGGAHRLIHSLKVDFAVDKPEARGMIKGGFPQLTEGLQSAGYGGLALTCRQARLENGVQPWSGPSRLDRRL